MEDLKIDWRLKNQESIFSQMPLYDIVSLTWERQSEKQPERLTGVNLVGSVGVLGMLGPPVSPVIGPKLEAWKEDG